MPKTPDWLVSMVRRETPNKDLIVEGSTPVVSFGDFRQVRVATLGINPSNLEFENQKGELLQGEKRRLATLTAKVVSPENRVNLRVCSDESVP